MGRVAAWHAGCTDEGGAGCAVHEGGGDIKRRP